MSRPKWPLEPNLSPTARFPFLGGASYVSRYGGQCPYLLREINVACRRGARAGGYRQTGDSSILRGARSDNDIGGITGRVAKKIKDPKSTGPERAVARGRKSFGSYGKEVLSNIALKTIHADNREQQPHRRRER